MFWEIYSVWIEKRGKINVKKGKILPRRQARWLVRWWIVHPNFDIWIYSHFSHQGTSVRERKSMNNRKGWQKRERKKPVQQANHRAKIWLQIRFGKEKSTHTENDRTLDYCLERRDLVTFWPFSASPWLVSRSRVLGGNFEDREEIYTNRLVFSSFFLVSLN